MEHRRVTGDYRHWLFKRSEASGFNRERVLANRDGSEEEFSAGITLHRLRKVRRPGMQTNIGARDGVVLRIEDDAADITKGRGSRLHGGREYEDGAEDQSPR